MTTPENKGQEELRRKVRCVLGYCEVSHPDYECLYENTRNETQELDTIMHLFNQELEARVKEAEERGASIAASAINREVGIEMTLNGSYYLDRHARGLAPLSQSKEEK